MAKVDRSNLGFLGEEFQYKLIKTFMDEPKFFKDIYLIVDQNMFTDANLRDYVGVMKEYYNKYELVPSYSMMEICLNDKAKTDIQQDFYRDVIKKLKNTTSEGIEKIREKSEKFFKQQNMIRVAHEIIKIAGDGDLEEYERCAQLVQDIATVGAEEDMGSGVYDNMDEVLSDDYRITIPTGIGKIDDALEGGLAKGELGVIIGGSSFGKAMSVNELVVTPDGYKRIGDIQINDFVIGQNGKPTKVSGVYPQGVRPLYKVTFSDGVTCVCDKEHLWNVNSLYQRSGEKYVSGLSKGRDDKYYVPDYSWKTLTLGQIMEKGLFRGKHKRHNFKVPMCEAVHFNEINVNIDPYLLGYFIGDGCFSRRTITVGVDDFNEASSLLKECSENHICSEIFHKRKNSKGVYSISYHKSFSDELSKYFNLSETSSEKFIPKDYLFNSLKNRIALLNGLMDSDGTCQKNGCSCFNTKSKQLAEDIKQLVLSLGGFAKVREKKASYFSKKYNEYRDCGIQYEVTITLCDPTIPIFRFKRKQDRVIYRTLRKNERFFHDIEYIGDDEAVCIKVDAEDELFLTNDFIVTHNTSMTTAMSSYAATYRCEQNDNKGFNVLQIIFEDRVKQIQRKHMGRLTNVEARNLSKPEYIESVRETLENFPDKETLMENLRIKRFPTGEVSPSKVRSFIKALINSGFRPDLVIIDYFECLIPDRDKDAIKYNEWSLEGKTMRKLETMAEEFNVALWVPTQGSKDSIAAELITMDKASGSAKKIQVSHIILSIARSMEQIEQNKANIAILKNRAGQAGRVINGANFNNGTCRIDTDNEIVFDSVMSFKKEEQAQRIDEIVNQSREVFQSQQKK